MTTRTEALLAVDRAFATAIERLYGVYVLGATANAEEARERFVSGLKQQIAARQALSAIVRDLIDDSHDAA